MEGISILVLILKSNRFSELPAAKPREVVSSLFKHTTGMPQEAIKSLTPT